MKRYDRHILFKETVRAEARGTHKLKKQTGGPGQFAIVEVIVRPLARNGGFRFIDSVVEGKIPADFIPAVEKGVREALAKGVVAGFPVVDVEVEAVDGAHHRKDSHARDFQFAAAMAFRAAMTQAKPGLLEPLGALEVNCPTPSLGWVMGQLAARRSRIRGTDFRDGLYVVRAEIPILELDGFEAELLNATSGEGSCTVRPSHDELMPEAVMSEVLRYR